MVVAIDEKFLDQTLRILSGEALAAEQNILAQNKMTSEFVYIPDSITHDDGVVETYHIAMDKDAKPEEIEAVKAEMQVRRKAAHTSATPDPAPAPAPAPTPGPQFADTINNRFPIDTLDDIQKSTVEFAEAMLSGEYGSEQREDILKRLGQARKDLSATDPKPASGAPETGNEPKPEKKDASDSFAEALDAALDNALLGAVDGVYYAFVRTFAGSYWDGDADQLSREDFNGLTELLATALRDVYDKLADDPEAARAAAMRSNDFANKALLGVMHDTLTDEQILLATKAGKRHSKGDENRMEIMHGALLGLGYKSCEPVEDDATNDETAKSLLKLTSASEATVATVRALFEKALSSEEGVTYDTASGEVTLPDGTKAQVWTVNPAAKKSAVTGSSSTGDPTPANTDDDAQTRIKAIEAELATVKAQAATSESELSRVKEEQQTRIAGLEEALQTQKSQLDKVQREPAGDPLDRAPEKVPTDGTEKTVVSGARRSYKQFTRELQH